MPYRFLADLRRARRMWADNTDRYVSGGPHIASVRGGYLAEITAEDEMHPHAETIEDRERWAREQARDVDFTDADLRIMRADEDARRAALRRMDGRDCE